ncbi:Hypothetical protein POVR1_LOCUS279 [uncultured virus]|nr:Hypothetical protein POVR1_LOCUS279 [uncultured virus]
MLNHFKFVEFARPLSYIIQDNLLEFLNDIPKWGIVHVTTILSLCNGFDPANLQQHLRWCLEFQPSIPNQITKYFLIGAFTEERMDFLDTINLNDTLYMCLADALDNIRTKKRVFTAKHLNYLIKARFVLDNEHLRSVICEYGDANAVVEFLSQLPTSRRSHFVAEILFQYRFDIMYQLKDCNFDPDELMICLIEKNLVAPIQCFLQMFPLYLNTRTCSGVFLNLFNVYEDLKPWLTENAEFTVAEYFFSLPINHLVDWERLARYSYTMLQKCKPLWEISLFFRNMDVQHNGQKGKQRWRHLPGLI